MLAFSRHDVWQGVEAWVADWDADGVVAFFLQKLDKDSFAVEASFSPTPKFDSVNFSAQFFLSRMVYLSLSWDKKCSSGGL